jgi:putative glutamine amidotransferase
MKDRIRVAITMRRSDATTYVEPRDAISHDWLSTFEQHGLIPVLVPGAVADPVGLLEASGARALVLSNGDDVGASPARDLSERALYDHAVRVRMPILGVCRGLQMINVIAGGRLSAVPGDQHIATSHAVALEGRLAAVMGARTVNVNSFHGSGVARSELAPALTPLACTADGLVEAFEHTAHKVLAVQWHLERPGAPAAITDHLLDEWLRA